MNDVIYNFKKPMDRKNRPEWSYKVEAISKIAGWLICTTVWQKIKNATWVPIPPSKIKAKHIA
jgi:hypothetical protein